MRKVAYIIVLLVTSLIGTAFATIDLDELYGDNFIGTKPWIYYKDVILIHAQPYAIINLSFIPTSEIIGNEKNITYNNDIHCDSNGMDIPEIIKKVKEFMRDNDSGSNSLRPYGFIKVDLKNKFTFYVAMNSANYPIALDRGLYFNRWRFIGDYISNTYNFNFN